MIDSSFSPFDCSLQGALKLIASVFYALHYLKLLDTKGVVSLATAMLWH